MAILFRLRILADIDVLFYRGVAIIAIVALATLLLAIWTALRMGLRGTDGLAAVAISVSINLSFLVLFPVTIDRSITVFLLGYMSEHPAATYTADDLKGVFSDRYLGQFHQIDRRMHEQVISSNIRRIGDRYQISPQGVTFIKLSRAIGVIFDVDPRFASPARSNFSKNP